MAVTGYSARQIVLHWVIAVLIAVQYLTNEGIGEAFREMMREGTAPEPTGMVRLHVLVGIAVLALVVIRLAMRFRRGAPAAEESESALQKLIAAVIHWGLYLLMVLIPVSGLFAWFGENRTPGEVHEALTTVLLIAVGVHVLGALVGQFVQKTGVLMRMVRPQR